MTAAVVVDEVTGEVTSLLERSAQASREYATSVVAQQFAQVFDRLKIEAEAKSKIKSSDWDAERAELPADRVVITGPADPVTGRPVGPRTVLFVDWAGNAVESRTIVKTVEQIELQVESQEARQRRPQSGRGFLGTDANNVSMIREVGAQEPDLKAERYAGRRYLWDVSTIEAVRSCGKVSIRAGGVVGGRITRLPDGCLAAGLSGLATCGSPWSCPVCSSKIAWVRSQELGAVLAKAAWDGKQQIVLLTLTLAHSREHSLADSWDGILAGFHRLISGRAYSGESEKEFEARLAKWQAKLDRDPKRKKGEALTTYEARLVDRRTRMVEKFHGRYLGFKRRHKVRGFYRAVECTRGCENGWHPHIHAAFVLNDKFSTEYLKCMEDELFYLWEKGIASKGFTALREPGCDLKVIDDPAAAGEYLTKQNAFSLAREVTFGQQKLARMQSRTPFQILADLMAFGVGDVDDLDNGGDPDGTAEPDDLTLLHEHERTARGRRTYSWSSGHHKDCDCGEIDCKGLREQYGVTEDNRTNEEIAAEDIGHVDVFTMSRGTVNKVVAQQLGLIRAMELNGAEGTEADGLASAEQWFKDRGLDYALTSPRIYEAFAVHHAQKRERQAS